VKRWGVVCALAGALLTGEAEAAGARTHLRYTGQVNLNEATLTQLDALPSVGEKAAQRILDWRQKRPFKRVEELVRVKGFGRKRFLRLKPYLTLQGETTLKTERVPAGAGPG
jgi:competence protein ComEA